MASDSSLLPASPLGKLALRPSNSSRAVRHRIIIVAIVKSPQFRRSFAARLLSTTNRQLTDAGANCTTMDSKLYTRLKVYEFQEEIRSYNDSGTTRPPLSILKKIIANLTVGNTQLIAYNDIFAFVCRITLQFGDQNEGVKKLGMLILEMFMSTAYKSARSGKSGTGAKDVDLDSVLSQLLPYLVRDAGDANGDVNALRILGAVDSGFMSTKMFSNYTNQLWVLANEKLSSDNEEEVRIEFIHVTIRLIQKIAKSEADKEMAEDKIKVIFSKLVNILNKFDNIQILSSVAETMLDLTLTNKYPYLRIQLTMHQVSKLISVITQLRSKPVSNKAEFGRVAPILALLTKYKIDDANKTISKDVITCVRPFMSGTNLSVVMNSIKCVIYYLGDTHDENFNGRVIVEIVKVFCRLFEFEDGKMVRENRTVFFNCLRNLILVVIKYGDEIHRKNGDIFKNLIQNYVCIHEEVDTETYIIDSKLELLYLLSIKGIEDEMVIRILLPLVRSANPDVSYKAIRTIGNLAVREPKYMDVMAELIEKVSVEKNLLAISIYIKDLTVLHGPSEEKVVSTYLRRVSSSKDRVHGMIAAADFKDEDVISYIWVLGEFGGVGDLLELRGAVWSRFELRSRLVDYDDDFRHKEMQHFIMDMYLTSLVKAWVRTGQRGAEVLALMRDTEKLSRQLSRRVTFYLQVIHACGGDQAKLRTVLLLPEMPSTSPDEAAAADEDSCGLTDETVSELCTVFGSLACVYLRGVHSVFRNG